MSQVRLKKGFTLVEIMITISIIGILLSVATPSLLRARQKAQEVELQADLRVIRDACERYNADLGVYPVNIGWLTHTRWVHEYPYGYNALGQFITVTNGAQKWQGPYLKLKESKKWISPYFGFCGEWLPVSQVPNTNFSFTGTLNANNEIVWVDGAGTDTTGRAYSDY